MKIVIIHYHLKTGGVSTVIKQQLEAIQNECQVLVLTGECPQADFWADAVTIPGLAYDRFQKAPPNPIAVSAEIMRAIRIKFGGNCDVVHVHNPMLAKNRHLLSILKQLKKNGLKLLLQIHDFAEDGRPSVYYPEAYISDCHYAVINSRDYQYLLDAGLSPTGLHLLSNTVTPMPAGGQKARSSNWVLYPVRAIRRKNIGEAILISLFFDKGDRLAITLPPNSPADYDSYRGWRHFVEDLTLAVDFEVGLRAEFVDLLRSARFILTTSIAEGFGFSFLEPWLADNILWGRKLPDICRDFENHGMQFDHLYDQIMVPLGWIDQTTFNQRWRSCVVEAAVGYGFGIGRSEIDQAFEKITGKKNIDFGMLDECLQKQIIQRIVSDPSAADRLRQINPFLDFPGDISDREDIRRHNRQVALTRYSQTKLKPRLMDVYARVASIPVTHRIDKSILLKLFLDLEKFSLLKWCHYVESADV